MIPQYILFSKFGWLNTFYPLIVPFFFGVPICIFLFRQFFLAQRRFIEGITLTAVKG